MEIKEINKKIQLKYMNLEFMFRTNYDKYAEIDLYNIIREKEDLLCKLILKQMVILEVFKLLKKKK